MSDNAGTVSLGGTNSMMSPIGQKGYGNSMVGGTVSGGMPQIDEKIVIKQKQKALKELASRVKLATSQHNKMYELQREHIVCEHDRQLQLAKAAIEDERAAAMMALEQAYAQNVRAIDHSAQSQKISIEQQANILEIQSIQHQMALQHENRERQWSNQSSLQSYQQPLHSVQTYFPQVNIPNFAAKN